MFSPSPLHEERTFGDWREVQLGEIVKSNYQNIGSNYPYTIIQYLDTGSITEGKIECFQQYTISEAPSRAKRLVRDGDIVYSNVRPIQRHYGFIKNPPDNLVVSTGFSVIKTDQSKADPLFIYYLLTSNNIVEELDAIAEGATSAYPSLRPSDIENLEILLPPLPEQKAIAEVLSSLDDKINLLHRQSKTLEDMAQALFRKWFVEDKDGEWEVGKLGDVVSISSGKGLKKSKYIGNGKYPVFGANGEIGRTDKYLFNDKLIFTGRVGTLGNIFISDSKAWLSDNTLVIKPKEEYFYFVYFFLKDVKLKDYNIGSTQPLIRQSDIKEVELFLPEKNKLQKFESQADLIFNKTQHNQFKIHTLENLRDTLLPKLMGGRIKVKF